MLTQLKEHLQFLILYGLDPEKAKIQVAKRYRELYNKKLPQEFLTWFQDTYTNKGDQI
jgi:hypothetical protein